MTDKIDIKALLTQGKTAFDNEDFKEALKLFTKASELEPNNQDIQFYLAISNNSLGHLDEAVACMKKVTNPPQDIFEFWSNIAHAYKNNREYHKSINAFKHALLCDPDDVNRDVIKSIIDNLVLKANYPPSEN